MDLQFIKGTVNIYDSIFINSSAYGNGGVIYNDNGNLKIKNGSFTNNHAYDNGGVIYNNNGKLNITN